MRLLRWLLVLPAAILLGMMGSLAGGILATPFGQLSMDTASAFVGTFFFVFAAGFVAPSHRPNTTLAAAGLVALLALVGFLLSALTSLEEFTVLSSRQRLLTPVAQLLGAAYALFILPPLVVPGTTLERLWREIGALGTLIGVFGLLLALGGIVAVVLGRGWFGVGVGAGVVLIGVITWVFPFAHMAIRMSKAEAMLKQQIRRLPETREQ